MTGGSPEAATSFANRRVIRSGRNGVPVSRARAGDRALARDLARAIGLDHAYDLARAFDHDRVFNLDLGLGLGLDLGLDPDCNLALALALALAHDRDLARVGDRDLARDLDSVFGRDPAGDLIVARLLQSDRKRDYVVWAGIGLLEAWVGRGTRSGRKEMTLQAFMAEELDECALRRPQDDPPTALERVIRMTSTPQGHELSRAQELIAPPRHDNDTRAVDNLKPG